MPRNFDRRVEVLVPITTPSLCARLRALLSICLADNRQAWELAANGEWTQCQPGDAEPRGTQAKLLSDPWAQERPLTAIPVAAQQESDHLTTPASTQALV
jgi:polyphosphate kinase